MTPHLYIYSGAGNDFVVVDGRGTDVSAMREPAAIEALCREHGTDGFMILDEACQGTDFRMEYYNSDGSGGMMCGNGGRCIVAFADALGIIPADGSVYLFEAADGLHTGEVLSRDGERKIVRIKMIDAFDLRRMEVCGHKGCYVNTGTRHFVTFEPDVAQTDVEGTGALLRHDPAFAPQGANINFVTVTGARSLAVRTFEKGVEAETLACGTGITASAIVAWYMGSGEPAPAGQPVHYDIRARIDDLAVDFIPASEGEIVAREVYLTGPATVL